MRNLHVKGTGRDRDGFDHPWGKRRGCGKGKERKRRGAEGSKEADLVTGG